jgi:ketosteroid isomerase-like protein
MSEKNVAVIRDIWEAWNRGDMDSALAPYHPDCVFDTTHYPEWPDVDVVRGREAIREFFGEFLATWESWNGRVETLLDAGDDRVLAIIRQSLRGRGSGVDVELHWAQIYTLRDGKIILIDNYGDRVEALEAVGLAE